MTTTTKELKYITLIAIAVLALTLAAPAVCAQSTVAEDTSSPLQFLAVTLLCILMILLIFCFLWLKKSLVLVTDTREIPGDGKSTLKLKAMLVNEFGITRAPWWDVKIEMRTSAGTIQDTVIPARKKIAEAVLTSPKGLGEATVTARKGTKRDSLAVSFTSAGAVFEMAPQPVSIKADGLASGNVAIRIKDGNGEYVVPLQPMIIQTRTTLGRISSPVVMLAGDSAINVAITADYEYGTARVTAACGRIKGECAVEIESIPCKYCYYCGTPMTLTAAACSACKHAPPSGTDTKMCCTCNFILPDSARYCESCGARQPGT